MLKEIFRYIRAFKKPEASLIVLLLLAAIMAVWMLYRESSAAYVKALETENKELKLNIVAIEKDCRKKIDECQDSRFEERMEKIIQMEKMVKMQDSIIAQLQRIKP